jgi:hypothetical protein
MSHLAIAVVTSLLGAIGLYAMNRRSFYRRNGAGIEEFTGYSRMLVTTFIERIVKMISVFMLLGGLSMLFLLLSR